MDSKTIGLGDIVKKVTDYFNIHLDDCGCEYRRQLLNRIQIKYPVGGTQWPKEENPQREQSGDS